MSDAQHPSIEPHQEGEHPARIAAGEEQDERGVMMGHSATLSSLGVAAQLLARWFLPDKTCIVEFLRSSARSAGSADRNGDTTGGGGGGLPPQPCVGGCNVSVSSVYSLHPERIPNYGYGRSEHRSSQSASCVC